MHVRKLLIAPGRTILVSILIMIAIGSLLLSCSWAQKSPVSFFDAIFTATSATCVTGLLTVPISSFSTSGQLVILALIQIGAIGLITMTVFLLSFFINLGLATNIMTGEALDIEGGTRPQRLVVFIILFTALIECIGWVVIFLAIRPYYPFSKALFISLFQSVSAFCNSGFTLLSFAPGALPGIAYSALLSTTGILVLVGSLGFIVWHEIAVFIRSRAIQRHMHFSLHTKLVLCSTAFLVTFMSAIIFILEYLHKFIEHPSFSAVLAAIFNGICLRSAGFSTLNFSSIHLATLFTIMIVSFIGSSPGSTGGGIKTTTFGIFLGAIRATLSRRTWVEIMGRTIPNDQVFKAMAIFSLSLCWLAVTIFLLLVTEQGWRFIDVMFEAFVAFTNLGISTHLTPHLSTYGKSIIMLSMLVGRIGSLTLLLAFKKQQAKAGYSYPEERVIMS